MNKASICVPSHQILGNLLIKQKPNAKIYQNLTPFNTCTHSSRIFAGIFFWALGWTCQGSSAKYDCKVKIKARTKAIAVQLPVLLVATHSDCDCMFAGAFVC